MTNKSKKSLESDTTCKWCSKSFTNERTLVAHMCPKKRRWADKDMTHVRLAFRVFQKFFQLTTTSTKEKTQEDFIRSQYYEGFTKFGRACVRNEWLDPERFAEWLIKKAVKLSDWCKDSVYDEYLLDYVKRETGLRALERTITYFTEWSAEHDADWNTYFSNVSTNRAVYDIRSAKVSPWVLYLSETGDKLLTRFSDEQVKMINHIIDANFWLKLFQDNPEEVDEVQQVCTQAGI